MTDAGEARRLAYARQREEFLINAVNGAAAGRADATARKPVAVRRRTPQEVAAYLNAHEAHLAALLPDEQERQAFKAELVAAAGRHWGRERILPCLIADDPPPGKRVNPGLLEQWWNGRRHRPYSEEEWRNLFETRPPAAAGQ